MFLKKEAVCNGTFRCASGARIIGLSSHGAQG